MLIPIINEDRAPRQQLLFNVDISLQLSVIMQNRASISMHSLLLLVVATMLSVAPQPALTLPNIIPPSSPDSAPFAHRIKITLPPAFQLGNADPSQPTGSNSMMLDADKIDQINININNSNNNNNEPTTASEGAGAGTATNGTGPVNNNDNNNNNAASTSGSTINININNNNNNNNDPQESASTPVSTTAPAAARF